jgi:hypothetical protein
MSNRKDMNINLGLYLNMAIGSKEAGTVNVMETAPTANIICVDYGTFTPPQPTIAKADEEFIDEAVAGGIHTYKVPVIKTASNASTAADISLNETNKKVLPFKVYLNETNLNALDAAAENGDPLFISIPVGRIADSTNRVIPKDTHVAGFLTKCEAPNSDQAMVYRDCELEIGPVELKSGLTFGAAEYNALMIEEIAVLGGYAAHTPGDLDAQNVTDVLAGKVVKVAVA